MDARFVDRDWNSQREIERMRHPRAFSTRDMRCNDTKVIMLSLAQIVKDIARKIANNPAIIIRRM